jgi:hypothetical protein
MTVVPKYQDEVWHMIDAIAAKDTSSIEDTYDILLWSHYGRQVFSQYGYGVYSWNFKLETSCVTLVIKAQESGTPLVAFVTSATTTSCIEKAMDLVEKGALKWMRDKYPRV